MASRARSASALIAFGSMLDMLRSEIRVRTYNLQLATCPAALTTAARLVEEGKTDEATKVLTTALNTLVIVDGPTSLPLLEVQAALKLADETAQKADEKERPERPRSWRPPRWRYGVGKRSATSTTSPQRTSRSRSTTWSARLRARRPPARRSTSCARGSPRYSKSRRRPRPGSVSKP